MVDVGTMPSPHSFARLFDAMQLNPQLGGVCGEIAVRSPRWYNLLEASQEFEYKISHVLDKGMALLFVHGAQRSHCVMHALRLPPY